MRLAPLGIGVSVLCPGFIRTKIMNSERNVPQRFTGPMEQPPTEGPGAEFLKMMEDRVSTGIDPLYVGELVREGIEQDWPYIFTDNEFEPLIDERFAAIKQGFDRIRGRSGIEVNPSLWSVLRLSQVCLGRGAGNAPVPRFCRAFNRVEIAINHLKVGQSPKIEQSRPGRVSVFAPHPIERDAMVHFGVPPQTARRFERSADFGCAAEVGCGHLGHSRTATRPRRRCARPRSCWGRYPKGQRANRGDKLVGRTRNKIPGPRRARLHGTVQVGHGT